MKKRHTVGKSGKRYDLARVRLNRQGYTSSGRYYGVGAPLFSCELLDADGKYLKTVEFRAKDRAEAVRKCQEESAKEERYEGAMKRETARATQYPSGYDPVRGMYR
jgi:hypothetical protein